MKTIQGIKYRHPEGTLMVLRPTLAEFRVGVAVAKLNGMTGSWLVVGPRGSGVSPAMTESESIATRYAQTFDHYARTGERVKFPAIRVKFTTVKTS